MIACTRKAHALDLGSEEALLVSPVALSYPLAILGGEKREKIMTIVYNGPISLLPSLIILPKKKGIILLIFEFGMIFFMKRFLLLLTTSEKDSIIKK